MDPKSEGDAETVAMLDAWYALVAATVVAAGGTLVKLLGDETLVTFPASRVRDADVYAHALNELFKAPWNDFEVMPAVTELAGAR